MTGDGHDERFRFSTAQSCVGLSASFPVSLLQKGIEIYVGSTTARESSGRRQDLDLRQ